MQVPIFYVNAFPNRPFSGNPAAVCLLNSWLDDDVMRKVAAENNLSATAFLVPRDSDYEIRWFTQSAPGKQSDIVSRFFAPAFGLPEDPVTGSAHSILTPYWTRRLGKPQLHARQLSQRGGELWCEMARDGVILRGKAVLTMKGMMEI